MLTAKLVRLDIAWSATPHPSRRAVPLRILRKVAAHDLDSPGRAVRARTPASAATRTTGAGHRGPAVTTIASGQEPHPPVSCTWKGPDRATRPPRYIRGSLKAGPQYKPGQPFRQPTAPRITCSSPQVCDVSHAGAVEHGSAYHAHMLNVHMHGNTEALLREEPRRVTR